MHETRSTFYPNFKSDYFNSDEHSNVILRDRSQKYEDCEADVSYIADKETDLTSDDEVENSPFAIGLFVSSQKQRS